MFRFTPYCSPHVRVWRWRWRCLASRHGSRRGRASTGSASTIASIDVPEAKFSIRAALEADVSARDVFVENSRGPCQTTTEISKHEADVSSEDGSEQANSAGKPPSKPSQWKMHVINGTSGFVIWLVSWQMDIADSISPCGISPKMVCMFVELHSDKANNPATLPSCAVS